VDTDPETLNIDLKVIESAVTSRTRAIFVVHYAGAPCDMNTIGALSPRMA
jgi:dTDP-4-amino-4,6-dideoxygalactose transaminase